MAFPPVQAWARVTEDGPLGFQHWNVCTIPTPPSAFRQSTPTTQSSNQLLARLSRAHLENNNAIQSAGALHPPNARPTLRGNSASPLPDRIWEAGSRLSHRSLRPPVIALPRFDISPTCHLALLTRPTI